MSGITSAKYATFFLVFSILFTYFSYSFSFATTGIGTWDLQIDIDDLYSAGILLGEGDQQNVTFNGGNVAFNLNSTETRVNWGTGVLYPGDRFLFSNHVFLFGAGIGWNVMRVRDFGNVLYNSSIVNAWNNETEYARFHFQNGYELFFVDPEEENNITRAVYDDGIVGVIVAQSVNFDETPNMLQFVGWYANIVTGTNSYGLPPQFNVVIQLITALSVLSLALIVKEMLRL